MSSARRVRRPRYRPERKLLPWEKKMPRPPRSVEVLREVLLSKISFFQPKQVHELHQEVQDDYGPVTDRSIYRHLEALLEHGLAKRVNHDDNSCYLRTGSWGKRPDVRRVVQSSGHTA